jgi:Fic family protein
MQLTNDPAIQGIITFQFMFDIVVTESLCDDIVKAADIIEHICIEHDIENKDSIFEVKLFNLYKGFQLVHTLPCDTLITEDLIKNLHKVLMEGKWFIKNEPGRYRTFQVKPAGSSDDSLYAQPVAIRHRLLHLCNVVNECMVTHKTIEERIHIAAWFLVKFLRIHPFVNGNGRAGRLLMYFILRDVSVIPCGLCIGTSTKRNRERYIKALELFNQKKDASDMCTLTLHSLIWSASTLNDICE